MIYPTIMKYFNQSQADENARYKSWEHCHRAFLENRVYTNDGQVDYLALHLAFYLASWGMLRGGSFLLQKDYRIHLPVVTIIQESRYAKLWDCSVESLQDDSTIDLILECGERIKAAYKEKIRIVNDKIVDGVEASPTLITKILLGTFGCTPAYDRYFVKGYDLIGLKHDRYGRKSLHELADFYKENLEFTRAMEEISRYGIYYPPAKLIDMYFWQTGYDYENGGEKPEMQEAEPVKQVVVKQQYEIVDQGQRRERGSIKAVVEQHLQKLLEEAARNGDEYVEVVSGEVAKAVGIKNRFPAITYAMKKFMRDGDVVVHSTPSGKSSTERIRYLTMRK